VRRRRCHVTTARWRRNSDHFRCSCPHSFTDIDSELDGGTAILSGSHLTDSGDATADKETHLAAGSCERITKIKAGSIVHFSEATIHSGVPVLSERTRYAMFFGFTPPWCARRRSDTSLISLHQTGRAKRLLPVLAC
jgi:ectoine hydroxylase-related dioxygenase (phytanoyl-CoA dioxygenase family)